MQSSYAVKGKVVTPTEIIDNGIVIIEDSTIIFAGPLDLWERPLPEKQIEVTDSWICPGFIDLHIHGAGGFDTMDGTPEAVEAISRQLAHYGVTSFLATTMTAEFEQLRKIVKNVADVAKDFQNGASIIGIHLEGPWINPSYKGAQNGEFIANPSLEQAQALYESSQGLMKIITIAPELPNANEVITYLTSKGVVVSAGHTGASFAQVEGAMESGLTHITHCFNAMTGLHHREPGTVGAAMYFDNLSIELIADGDHVHPVAMSILHRLKKSTRLALVSDSMRAAGLGEGEYDLGGQQVFVNDGRATLENGTLAGSVLTLNRAVGNMVELCDIPLTEAVAMASQTPADILGISEKKGKLSPGYDADIVILQNNFEVAATMVKGRFVYSKDK